MSLLLPFITAASLHSNFLAAQDAFTKIGKLLQKRRKTDLYEMVSYFSGAGKDPALEDPNLLIKLNENLKHQRQQINDLIDK